ncbi:type II 3-dehydroquinate dehydratase [Candidatus Vidania fulgoroideorum]
MIKNNIKIKILNGPNMNILGIREKIYGNNIENDIKKSIFKIENLYYFQSNSEKEIINEIHSSINNIKYFVINLTAFSYYSISILDALLSSKIPFYEVHISNVFKREKLRSKSIFSKYSKGFISGFGINSYIYSVINIIGYNLLH